MHAHVLDHDQRFGTFVLTWVLSCCAQAHHTTAQSPPKKETTREPTGRGKETGSCVSPSHEHILSHLTATSDR